MDELVAVREGAEGAASGQGLVEGGSAFADYLESSGLLGGDAIERARRAAKETSQSLTGAIVKLGLMSEPDCTAALAAAFKLTEASEDDFPEAPILEKQLPLRFLESRQMVPLAEEEGGPVRLALVDPTDDFSLKATRLALGRPLELLVATPALIERQIERLYRGGGVTDDLEELADQEFSATNDVEKLRDLASDAPVVRLVNRLITRAVERGASDIHIDPVDQGLRVRYRIDGMLIDVEQPALSLRPAILSRIKLLAQLNIAEHRLPQDGRIRLVVRGRDIDLRVATLPTLSGESVVIRVLDRSSVSLDYSSLGFSGPRLDRFEEMVRKPNGIVLVSGPTGSGKTTTLYTALSGINTSDKKIITVEDPVEYELEGIVQVQVKPQIGLTFAHVLRSTLRHNPNIVLIGEIRDLETAQIAVQAALTGHLVLSTLHTNSAAASISRLLDMGLEDYLLTSTLNGISAQRLVRRLCPSCKEPEVIPRATIDRLVPGALGDDVPEEVTVWRPKAGGCEHCNGTGYRGRSVIFELLDMSSRIRRHVLDHDEAQAIEATALTEGFVTMRQDGVQKVLDGVTSLDEILRATREG